MSGLFRVEQESEGRVRKAVCGESRMHGLERGKGRETLPIVTES
jgi:hypothetical protein